MIYLISFALVLFLAGAAQAVSLQPDDGSISDNLSLWLREPATNFDPDTGVWTDVSPKGNDAKAVGTVGAWGVTYVAPILSSGSNSLVFDNDFSTVMFAADTDDLMLAANLNGGTGLSELTILVVYKVPNSLSETRPVGFGSTSGGGSNSGNKFNLAADSSIRKDNGSITGVTVQHPVDEFFIRVARMNSGGVDQWYNSNGTLVQVLRGGGTAFTTSTDNFYLGDVRCGASPTSGSTLAKVDIEIAEVVVYNTALSNTQIEGISEWLQANIGVVVGVLASNPIPADKTVDVPRDVVLSWTPGDFADKHDVYFDSNFIDVNDASRTNPLNVLLSQDQTASTYDPVGLLEFGKTYYWRIDEVNAPPTSHVAFKGGTWSFTVEPKGYPVAGDRITATVSSQNSPNEGPEKTVDGSGLDESGGHSQDAADMWLSAESEPGMAWIKYDLDQAYKLSEMMVWNHNGGSEQIVGFGIKEAAIEYSADGNDFTLLGTVELARAAQTMVDLQGVVAKSIRITAQSKWGDFYSQYGLSEVSFLYIPVWATEPSPDSGATDMDVDAILSFRAGREAAKHDVYLSTDEQAVIDGTAPVAGVTDPSYAASLDLASTYYWRIDEVNDAESWQGDVWSFSTQEYLVVDDFEDFNGDNPIWKTWLDGIGFGVQGTPGYYPGNGTGSAGGNETTASTTEETIVYDGIQSMPLFYNNTVATYSEVTANVADLKVDQDWSRHGIKALTLRFFGDPNNILQQMYVKINGYKVTYDGSAEDTRLTGWQMWYIDLASTGVSLSNVTELSIGFERIGAFGGQGVVFLDAIRLYSYDRQLITPVVPGAVGLQAHYEFEGTTNDSSGNARNGTAMGNPVFVAGRVGQAISFDGLNNYVEITGYKGILGSSAITVTAWIKTSSTDTGAIVGWGPDVAGQRLGFRVDVGRLRVEHAGGNIQGYALVNDGGWHHVAVTVQENATISYPEVIIYLDGMDDTMPTTDPDAFNITAGEDVCIGRRPSNNDRFFMGQIDDVRIYERVLSPGEIAGSAGRTMPYDKPF